MVTPVLANFAQGTLKDNMPVEGQADRLHERQRVSHLEAIARSLAGLAPWFEATGISPEGRGSRGLIYAGG